MNINQVRTTKCRDTKFKKGLSDVSKELSKALEAYNLQHNKNVSMEEFVIVVEDDLGMVSIQLIGDFKAGNPLEFIEE